MAGAIGAGSVVLGLLSKSPLFMFRAALWLIISLVNYTPSHPPHHRAYMSYLPLPLGMSSRHADRGFNRRWRINSFGT